MQCDGKEGTTMMQAAISSAMSAHFYHIACHYIQTENFIVINTLLLGNALIVIMH
jgi:hypothetical protein